MPRRPFMSLLALAAALLLAMLLSACGGKNYVHEKRSDRQYTVDRYNCEWDVTHADPNLDGDEVDRRVEQCLKDLGWTEKQDTPEEDDDSGWWPW